ncbi:MAG: single-stranded DNA-binding protein [Mycoplasma sp.]|nr:single-stranded DNA-binding protein [Mycoplasma sp.]
MNKVLLVGNLVRKPEMFQTQSGINYTRVTIAVSRQFGENQTDFIPIVIWRQQSEFISKYAIKGSKISVEGRFSSSTYKNADGNNVTNYEVTAERIQLLDSKAETERKLGNAKEVSNESSEIQKSNNSDPKEETQNKDMSLDVPWELDL